ncbi:hypothetical protein AHAS_Ahas11G0153300 [Arachis hypogaea]
MWSEERLAKFKQSSQPKFSLYCMEGKIELPLLSVPPDELIQLHTGGDQRNKSSQNKREINLTSDVHDGGSGFKGIRDFKNTKNEKQ